MDADLVVDVGANIGDWSVSVAHLTKAKKIIAFEPIPQVFEKLCRNVTSFPQIHCINSAVGAEIGHVVIHVEQNTALSSVFPISNAGRSYHGLIGKPSCMITVPCITLDTMFAESTEISLLKIDVQGYEESCLRGGANTLRKTRVILIEVMFQPYYNGAKDFTDLFRILLSIDDRFRLYSVSAPHCSVDGIPLWADAVFVQR
jgi:FkbM family methyltransferase